MNSAHRLLLVLKCTSACVSIYSSYNSDLIRSWDGFFAVRHTIDSLHRPVRPDPKETKALEALVVVIVVVFLKWRNTKIVHCGVPIPVGRTSGLFFTMAKRFVAHSCICGLERPNNRAIIGGRLGAKLGTMMVILLWEVRLCSRDSDTIACLSRCKL